MSSLDQEQDIIDLANTLGVKGQPVDGIIEYCQGRVDAWVDDASGVANIGELELLVADRLNLTYEEFFSDDEFDEVCQSYIARGEIVFAQLPNEMTPDTFGLTLKLQDGSYVALVDARGDKESRRFFTKWHEVAHVLVLDKEDTLDRPVFRSANDPTERLMDQIAGHVGFYAPLFNPILHSNRSSGQPLTFDAVECVRQSFCPHASFQSTLFACRRRMDTPMLYVEAEMRYKKDEQRKLQHRRLFEDDAPQAKLRIAQALPNSPARASGLAVRRNMQVPTSSVISRVYHDDSEELSGDENLSDWTFSTGGSLGACDVFVQARRFGDKVMAILQPKN